MRSPRAWLFLSALLGVICWLNGGLIALAGAATEALSGTTWRLVGFQDANGRVVTAEAGSSYTVEFRTDDTVAAQVDCHRGRGTWVSRSASQLELGPLALTRATCPQTPLHAQIARQWTSVRSYALRDGHLFLSLGANGGTYEFAPASAVAAERTTTASATTAPEARAPAEPGSAAAAPVPATPASAAPVPGAPTPAATTPAVTARTATVPAATAPTTAAPAPAATAASPNARPSWLDDSKPASWTSAGAPIPRAPYTAGTIDPRCRTLVRPAESDADKQLTEQGWDLIGAYQGGWEVVVLEGAASYDGMCRPLAYQEFVFVRGAFAGTLSPGTMDSRADGSLNRVTLQGDRRLVAEYARYASSDALCCPSRTTSVVFEIDADQAVVRPLSMSTFSNR